MKEVDPVALFRLSVLGPLVSRTRLARGELQAMLRELASKEYDIPGSRRRQVAEKTLQIWFYRYRREGLAGLAPKQRSDHGRSKISTAVQERLLATKRENPRRSLHMLQQLLEDEGVVPRGTLSRSAIHRFLQRQGLSRPVGADSQPEERRSFLAEHANQIWFGDVMHGPRVLMQGRSRKTYLVSLLDDASRLIVHSAFCLAETALEIEGVLKQGVLKRGLPAKIIVDNGSAYRSASLQGICARLSISLIYCRPYAPEGKGKLERWHRTTRSQFLSELNPRPLALEDLNARLWAWTEQVYHRSPHAGLGGRTPLERYQQDLPHIRLLGLLAAKLDAIFQHRIQRLVRKDGTVSYEGRFFEVPYELTGKTVWLVVDPHTHTAVGVEDEAGVCLGAVTPLDALANRHRLRRKPAVAAEDAAESMQPRANPTGPTLVDLAYARHYGPIGHPTSTDDPTSEGK
jgi:transposase InsO family protein